MIKSFQREVVCDNSVSNTSHPPNHQLSQKCHNPASSNIKGVNVSTMHSHSLSGFVINWHTLLSMVIGCRSDRGRSLAPGNMHSGGEHSTVSSGWSETERLFLFPDVDVSRERKYNYFVPTLVHVTISQTHTFSPGTRTSPRNWDSGCKLNLSRRTIVELKNWCSRTSEEDIPALTRSTAFNNHNLLITFICLSTPLNLTIKNIVTHTS